MADIIISAPTPTAFKVVPATDTVAAGAYAWLSTQTGVNLMLAFYNADDMRALAQGLLHGAAQLESMKQTQGVAHAAVP
jgi:hypothetical protein